AGGAAPQHVDLAVAIEVAQAGYRPGGRDGDAVALVGDGGVGADDAAVHQPQVECAGGAAPEHVGFAVAVEVAHAGDCPAGRHGNGRTVIGDRCASRDVCAVHQPDPYAVVGSAPEDVRLAIAVEVAGAIGYPVRWYRRQVHAAGDRRAIH